MMCLYSTVCTCTCMNTFLIMYVYICTCMHNTCNYSMYIYMGHSKSFQQIFSHDPFRIGRNLVCM